MKTPTHYTELTPEQRATCDELARALTDKGKIIAAGFVGFQIACVSGDTPADEVEDMRKAFMAGAHHLFASIMQVLDPDGEPTAADLRRMAMIDRELNEFVLSLRH